MSNRKLNVLSCLTALLVGGLLYILFRPGTYISSLFNRAPYIIKLRQICLPYASNASKFYTPDFLWAFALGCGLIAICAPKKRGILLCSLLAFLCGVAWELLQYMRVFSGTSDICDIIMYALASALCIIINLKEIKKGASLEVEVAYTLNDSTSEIEVEVKELFSFQNTLITKTFSIA